MLARHSRWRPFSRRPARRTMTCATDRHGRQRIGKELVFGAAPAVSARGVTRAIIRAEIPRGRWWTQRAHESLHRISSTCSLQLDVPLVDLSNYQRLDRRDTWPRPRALSSEVAAKRVQAHGRPRLLPAYVGGAALGKPRSVSQKIRETIWISSPRVTRTARHRARSRASRREPRAQQARWAQRVIASPLRATRDGIGHRADSRSTIPADDLHPERRSTAARDTIPERTAFRRSSGRPPLRQESTLPYALLPRSRRTPRARHQRHGLYRPHQRLHGASHVSGGSTYSAYSTRKPRRAPRTRQKVRKRARAPAASKTTSRRLGAVRTGSQERFGSRASRSPASGAEELALAVTSRRTDAARLTHRTRRVPSAGSRIQADADVCSTRGVATPCAGKPPHVQPSTLRPSSQDLAVQPATDLIPTRSARQPALR